ncbi:MAG: hypothetical protein JNL70_06595 [Saprospiraceae bacterium]|nr:hypothetical protein [Saprospiraceae bacterium]
MIENETLAAMSIQEISQAIEERHKEMGLFYESMASKITSKTTGVKPMSDDKVSQAEYWLKVAKDQRRILSMDFDLVSFEEAVTVFKLIVNWTTENGNLTVKLKTAREIAARDCFAFCSIVRRAVQEKKKEPVYALILEKEPSPRQPNSKNNNSNGAEAKSDKKNE